MTMILFFKKVLVKIQNTSMKHVNFCFKLKIKYSYFIVFKKWFKYNFNFNQNLLNLQH